MTLDEEISKLNQYIRKAQRHNSTDNEHYKERVQLRDWLCELKRLRRAVMKKRFRLEDYKGKYVMHCDTEDKANKFLEYLDKQGKKWSGGIEYGKFNCFDFYGSITCYNFNKGSYSDYDFYIHNGYNVLEFDDFDWSEETTMKVYISGAISGSDDYMKRFGAAEERLIKQGYEVINPAAVNVRLPKSTTYDEYMQVSFLLLNMCEAIYMLNGWEDSHGASMEYDYAYAKDMVIMKEGSDCNE